VPGTEVDDQVTIKIELDKRKFAIATSLRRTELKRLTYERRKKWRLPRKKRRL
jgi:hypothetical protein